MGFFANLFGNQDYYRFRNQAPSARMRAFIDAATNTPLDDLTRRLLIVSPQRQAQFDFNIFTLSKAFEYVVKDTDRARQEAAKFVILFLENKIGSSMSPESISFLALMFFDQEFTVSSNRGKSDIETWNTLCLDLDIDGDTLLVTRGAINVDYAVGLISLRLPFGACKEPALKRLNNDTSVSLLTPEQMLSLTKDYIEVRGDEGASGRPADYAASLEYVSPARDFPGKWPQMPLCGCCSVPFAIDARRSGLWVAQGYSGRQAGTVVPICGVCITYINSLAETSVKRIRFPLPDDYDAVGQQMCTRFTLDDLTKLALVRLALVSRSANNYTRNGQFLP